MGRNREHEFAIPGPPVAFTYVTGPQDDLRNHCRSDLRHWEPLSRRFFWWLAREARVVIDVGAYTGVYSVTAALATPDSAVIAVEPNPELRDLLDANLAANRLADRVEVHRLALGDRAGSAVLHQSTVAGLTSTASLIPSSRATGGVPVDVAVLPDLLGDRRPDLVKIDIEGGEAAALVGAAQVLGDAQPVLLIEALTNAERNRQAEVLGPLGYGYLPVAAGDGGAHGDRRNNVWCVPRDIPRAMAALNWARGT